MFRPMGFNHKPNWIIKCRKENYIYFYQYYSHERIGHERIGQQVITQQARIFGQISAKIWLKIDEIWPNSVSQKIPGLLTYTHCRLFGS